MSSASRSRPGLPIACKGTSAPQGEWFGGRGLTSGAADNAGGATNWQFHESGYAVTTMRRFCSLLSAVFLLVFLIGLSPHLVHHVFDEHEDLASPEACPFATVAERQHFDSPGETALHPGPDHAAAAHQAGEPPLASIAAAPVTTRAPPTASF